MPLSAGYTFLWLRRTGGVVQDGQSYRGSCKSYCIVSPSSSALLPDRPLFGNHNDATQDCRVPWNCIRWSVPVVVVIGSLVQRFSFPSPFWYTEKKGNGRERHTCTNIQTHTQREPETHGETWRLVFLKQPAEKSERGKVTREETNCVG